MCWYFQCNLANFTEHPLSIGWGTRDQEDPVSATEASPCLLPPFTKLGGSQGEVTCPAPGAPSQPGHLGLGEGLCTAHLCPLIKHRAQNASR